VRACSDAQLAIRFDRPDLEDHGDFALAFPHTHLRLTGGRPDLTINWPWPGNDAGLADLITHVRESGDEVPDELLFKIINHAHAEAGRKPWTPRDFAMVAAEVDDARDARDEADAERLVVHLPGRRKSQNTYIVEKICATVHCGERRGRYILRDGVSKLDQQKALALAFSNDPDRRLPRHWALKNGGSWGSPKRDSFTRYVLDCIDRDAFEETAIGAALAILAPRFDEGWLLDANELECLLRTIREQALPITAETALDLWARYDQWKRRGF
jgi:hypothetical protein